MTKQLMKDALLELLEKQKLVNITVTAICETADVHRSTFYKYYTDPEDLLRVIERDFLDRIPMPSQNFDQQNQEQLLTATTAYFDDVKKNIKAYRILLGIQPEAASPKSW
jgi:AcrR family transcriptional regulator